MTNYLVEVLIVCDNTSDFRLALELTILQILVLLLS